MNYVLYEMTWKEFELRMFSYKRQKEREDRNFREVAWNSLISFNVKPQSIPKTKDRFWSIGDNNVKQTRASEKARELLLLETQKYNERKSKS